MWVIYRFPDWVKNKKATTNPINKKDNKCFQYAITVTVSQEEIGYKSFINEYYWKEIHFPSGNSNWKELEKNNVTIALNVLHAKKEKTYTAYVSKHNSNREKQVIPLMIPNRGWHSLTVKKLLALLIEVTSKHHGDSYCLNCLYSENKR